jgi:hypothetical protein
MSDPIVTSVILRCMKGSLNFVRGGAFVPVANALPLEPGEVIVGTYQAFASQPVIVFTETALHIVDRDHHTRLAWGDIIGYESPKPRTADGVLLRTASGTQFVPMAGSFGPEGKFKDAFNLAMVLRSLLGRRTRSGSVAGAPSTTISSSASCATTRSTEAQGSRLAAPA